MEYIAAEKLNKGDAVYLSDDGKAYRDRGMVTCKNIKCGKQFHPHRDDQEYCTKPCSIRAKRLRNYYKNKKESAE